MVSPVVTHVCESWTIKGSWASKNWCLDLWCWRRLLRVPWTARRFNQSILKEINPEYSLEGLMLKLKLQDFGHLMRRAKSLEKTLMLGKMEGGRRRGWHRMRCLAGITDLMDMRLSKLREMGKDREAWHAAVLGVEKSQIQLSDWICGGGKELEIGRLCPKIDVMRKSRQSLLSKHLIFEILLIAYDHIQILHLWEKAQNII